MSTPTASFLDRLRPAAILSASAEARGQRFGIAFAYLTTMLLTTTPLTVPLASYDHGSCELFLPSVFSSPGSRLRLRIAGAAE
jgi:hypothetical protein